MMIHHLQGAHLQRWGWMGSWWTLRVFLHPRRSAPSSRTQVPPKPVASDRPKKAEQNLVLSNQFSALSDDNGVLHYPVELVRLPSQLRRARSAFNPAVFGLQEKYLTNSKTPSFSGFNILTKNSLNDRATRAVALLINKSCLFSEVIWTPLCRHLVASRVVLNKVFSNLTFCSIYLDQIMLPRLIWLTWSNNCHLHSFFWCLQRSLPGLG